MYARVTAVVVARNGADYLERTLAGLAAQLRAPDALVVVDAGSSDESHGILAAAHPTQFITANTTSRFGAAVSYALGATDDATSPDDWLWLLAHDNAPEPGALATLLGAVEIAPSVAVAGPKLMRWDKPDMISSYGETITTFGTSVEIVADELDQAQHDRESDLLAVAAGGMLVRRSVWAALGGFDPALPSVDAALDFCIRVRLAGHRIVGVPAARVASAGGPELFGRRSVSTGALARLQRGAQLHRRLTYAPAPALPLHWLSLLPLAIIRSIGHLLGKRPGAIGGELSAAFAAIFSPGVAPARRNLRRSRVLGWAAIAPLRMTGNRVRDLRATRREATTIGQVGEAGPPRLSFLSDGGGWIVLLAGAIGLVMFAPLFGAAALTGGGLAPLSDSVAGLWANVGYGWREVGAGFVGAADPFALLLAVLGTLTFWAPSQSIVVLYLAALPLAALGAWWCASRFAVRAWAPAIAALLWALAPPFLASLSGGSLGAVIAHLLLPWFVLALISSARNWSASAAAALLFAAIAASAPALIPALLIGWLAWTVSHPTKIHRHLAIPLPAAVLFAPLVWEQVARGNPLAIFADPGVPTSGATTSGWALALGAPTDGYHGWTAIAESLGLAQVAGPIIVAALLAPLAALALLALFLPGSRRSIPAMVVALLGFVTAVAGAHLEVSLVGASSAAVWPGSGLSLFWLGLVGAVVIALESLGRGVAVPALLVAVTAAVLAGPLLVAPIAGTAVVTASTGRMLPAFVTAEAATNPSLGTLELVAQSDGGLAAILHRGAGTTLDAQSTLATTRETATESQERIAVLAGNLASRSGFDSAAELTDLGIGFVVSPNGADANAQVVRKRAGEALDANPAFTAIGETANGFLWSFDAVDSAAEVRSPSPLDTAPGVVIVLVQGFILVLTILLAVPTPGRRRVRAVRTGPSEPASTFEEDDNA